MVEEYTLRCDPQMSTCELVKSGGDDAREITPPALAKLLAQCKQPVRVVIPDRLLVGFWGRSRVDEPTVFSEFRQSLFAKTLRSIVPLTTMEQSYLPHQTDSVSSGLLYEPGTTSPQVHIFQPQSRLDGYLDAEASWRVDRSDFQAVRRLDPWYYQERFIDLRKRIRQWSGPTLEDTFDIVDGHAHRLELAEKPRTGALQWVSSAQIHALLHCIDVRRIRDGWGAKNQPREIPPRPDAPLKDGDFLITMSGISDVKIAEYYTALGPSARSDYVQCLRYKESRAAREDIHERAVLWRSLIAEDFLDQVRMELSNRTIIPLKHVFPRQARLPEIPHEAESTCRVRRLMSHCASSSTRISIMRQKLRDLAEYLFESDLRWPGRFACCRSIWRAIDEHLDKNVLVLSSDKKIAHEIAVQLTESGIPARGEALSCDSVSLCDEQARRVAKADFGVLVTSAIRPMSTVDEHVGFGHALDILAYDHLFVLHLPREGPGERPLPGRQLLRHVFSEAAYPPRTMDMRVDGVPNLAKALRRRAKPGTIEDRLRAALMRLSRLGASTDFPAPSSGDAALGHELATVRRVLSELAVTYHETIRSSPDKPETPPKARREAAEKPKEWEFGRFRTVCAELGEKLQQFEQYIEKLSAEPSSRTDETQATDEPVSVVLVQGETGTGKDTLVAHFRSKFADGGNAPEAGAEVTSELVCSQLFGHVKGAFTGAISDHEGLFELAKKQGLLTLNEINSFPLDVQLRLLKVLDKGIFYLYGGEGDIKCRQSFRGVVFALTNADLWKLVKEGKFRADLLMRMGIPLVMPPLRDRREDIDFYCDQFLDNYADRLQVERPVISEDAMDAFHQYAWPGNVRELRLLMRHAVNHEVGRVDLSFLERDYPAIVVDKSATEECPDDLALLNELLGRHFEDGLQKQMLWEEFNRQAKGNELTTNGLAQWVRPNFFGCQPQNLRGGRGLSDIWAESLFFS